MALRNIREEGDALLLKKSRPVTDFDRRLHILIDDMRETLINADGVGLAAPQVGVLRRLVLVMDTSKEELTPEEQIIELINPEIIKTSGSQEGPEGCLSVPGVYGLVKRPDYVKVRAQDRHGKTFEVEGTGLTARCFCHEIDHLDGHLFTEISERILSEEELEEYSKKSE
ncbi:MAG: peptide deformylase [Oscillospiraceae bacterium]|nr:peptide deformylase [Oscillospiraceae bacterium]MBQ1730449.1 peptide deformylase [Oscillospiraceae bacterium]MBQ1768810.1 peptide deformylase [Oscillospiraceae bacterium]MBQ2057559.1 peptide deformylase [Oscillospiraceae bacterium]MBQ2157912.1 peptide deformylase [Oscillospiraceae bacterium]